MAAVFLDIQERQAEVALDVATDLRLLGRSGADFIVDNPLCRLLATANQNVKAAILRIVLESYEPFLLFRQRYQSTLDLQVASRQTKAQLMLSASRDEVRDTMISLGSFSQALFPTGGGEYNFGAQLLPDALATIAAQAIDLTAAAQRIRIQIGPLLAATADQASVITPLANALMRAAVKDGRGAVVEAGNAVESYMTALAATAGVVLTGATGLGAKIDRFSAPAQVLPKKLIAIGKYLSNVRNAADHGVDLEIGKAWEITEASGIEYVFVACTFLKTTFAHISNTDGII